MKQRAIQPERVKRVVVRGANWVGDAVMTVPALRELRRLLPGAHITLATRPWAEGIFHGADFVDDVLTEAAEARGANGVVGQARAWRGRRFDLAVLLPNAFAPALVARAARVPLRVGYATEGRALLLTHPLPLPGWRGRRHEVFDYLNIVSQLGRLLYGAHSDLPEEPAVTLHVSDERKRAARELLGAEGLDLERPVVALCPGSTNSRAKRWPAKYYAALADLLAERDGAQVVLVGAAEELAVSAEVAGLMKAGPAVLTGRTSLAETAALLSVADLLISNDTGPAHLAAAVGSPVLVIFGPTNPVTTRPFSPLAEVVRRPPFCAPCMLRDCPIDHRCMTAVTPEEVYGRAALAVASRRGAEAAR